MSIIETLVNAFPEDVVDISIKSTNMWKLMTVMKEMQADTGDDICFTLWPEGYGTIDGVDEIGNKYKIASVHRVVGL